MSAELLRPVSIPPIVPVRGLRLDEISSFIGGLLFYGILGIGVFAPVVFGIYGFLTH